MTLQGDVKGILVFWYVPLCQSLSSSWRYEGMMHPVTWHHIQEDTDPQRHCCENLESCTWCQIFSKIFCCYLQLTPTNSCHTFCTIKHQLYSSPFLHYIIPTVKSLRPIPRLKQVSGLHLPLVLKLFRGLY